MKTIKLTIILLFLIYSGGQGQSLSPKVTPTLGGYATGTGISISYTMGETHTVTLQGGALILSQGEQQPEVSFVTGTIIGSPFCAGAAVSVPFIQIGRAHV